MSAYKYRVVDLVADRWLAKTCTRSRASALASFLSDGTKVGVFIGADPNPREVYFRGRLVEMEGLTLVTGVDEELEKAS